MAELSMAESREYRALFNPAAVAVVLARQCQGAVDRGRSSVPLTVAAAGTLIAFHPRARKALPGNIRTNLVSWLEREPQVKVDVAASLRGSQGWLRQGVVFALAHDVCSWLGPASIGVGSAAPALRIAGDSDMTEMQRSAFFLGRWLPEAGSEATVLALLGMRP